MSDLRWVKLVPHPEDGKQPVASIRVGFDVHDADWRLSFEVFGEIALLHLPPVHGVRAGDRLWEHSCFECFIGKPTHGYREINLAPNGACAGYDFTGYRSGRRPFRETVIAHAESRQREGRYRLDCVLSNAVVPDTATHLGFAVIIEVPGQGLRYWALQHAPGAPDFHHSQNRRIDLR